MVRIWDDLPVLEKGDSEKQPLTPAEEAAIGIAPGPVGGTQTFAPGISSTMTPAEEVAAGIAPGPVSGVQTVAPAPIPPATGLGLGIEPPPVPSSTYKPPTPNEQAYGIGIGQVSQLQVPGYEDAFKQVHDILGAFEEQQAMQNWGIEDAEDVFNTYSGRWLGTFDFMQKDVQQQVKKDLIKQDILSYGSRVYGDNYEDFSMWKSIYDQDPIVAAGMAVKEELKREKINLIMEGLKSLDANEIIGGADGLTQQQKNEIMSMALGAALDDIASLDSKELGSKFIYTLNKTYSDALDTVASGGPDVMEQIKYNSMTDTDRKRYNELKNEVDRLEERKRSLEAEGADTSVIDDEILWRKKDMNSLLNRYTPDSRVVLGTAEALKLQKAAIADGKFAISELMTNPAKYEQLKAMNEQAKSKAHNELYEKYRNAGYDEFQAHIMAEQELGKKTEFEKDINELMQDKSKAQAIMNDPLSFLAMHFKYLSPQDIGNALGFRDSTIDLAVDRLKLSGRYDPAYTNQESNPFWIDPFKTPLERMSGGVEKVLVAVGIPEEIAGVAAQVAVLAPAMIASTVIGGPAGLAAVGTYYGSLETAPRLGHNGLSRESLVALADLGTTMAVLSPATNAMEEAVVKSIINTMVSKSASEAAIQMGEQTIVRAGLSKAVEFATETAVRAGLNIIEDVPTTAIVLALSGVEPDDPQFMQIMRDVVVFDAALGVAMPLSANYFNYGIPELGAYATSYVASRYLMGMNDDDARKAALGIAASVAIARHGILGKSVIASERAFDVAKAVTENIAGTVAAKAMDAIGTAIRRSNEEASLVVEPSEVQAGRAVTIDTESGKKLHVAPKDATEILENTDTIIRNNDDNIAWKPNVEVNEKTSHGVFQHVINALSVAADLAQSKGKVTPSDVLMMLDDAVLVVGSGVKKVADVASGGAKEIADAIHETVFYKTLQQAAANGNRPITIDELHELNDLSHGVPVVKTEKIAEPLDITGDTVSSNRISLKTMAQGEDGPKILDAVVLETRDVMSREGRVFRVIDNVKVADGVSDDMISYGLRQAILETMHNGVADGISINKAAPNSDKLLNALDQIASEADLKLHRLKNPDVTVLEWKINSIGNENMVKIIGAARVPIGESVKAVSLSKDAFTHFGNSIEDVIKKTGGDVIKAAIPSISMYILDEYIRNSNDDTWDNAKESALIFGFSLLGTSGARIARRSYRLPGASIKHEFLASSFDEAFDRFVSKEKLSVDQRIGNMIRKWIGNTEAKDMPLVAAAAQDLKRAFRHASAVADHYSLLTNLIIKDMSKFAKVEAETGHIVMQNGKKIPLLVIDESATEGVRFKEVDGVYATMQDVAARMPLYESLLKSGRLTDAEAASLGAVINAAKEIRKLIEPITKDLYDKGILEAKNGEDRIRKDIILDYTDANVEKASGFYLPRGRVVGFQDGEFFIGSQQTVGFRKAKPSWQKEADAGIEATKSMGFKSTDLMEDTAYLPLDVTIREFTSTAIQSIATKAFAEIIIHMNDVAGAKLFEYPENRIPPELRETYNKLKSDIEKAERRLRTAQRRQESSAALADKIERALPSLQKKLAALQERISSEKLKQEEKILMLKDALDTLETDMRKKFIELRENAKKFGATSEELKELNKRERQYMTRLKQLKKSAFGQTYEEVINRAMGVRLPSIDLLPAQIETLLKTGPVRQLETYKGFIASLKYLSAMDKNFMAKLESGMDLKDLRREYNRYVTSRREHIKNVVNKYIDAVIDDVNKMNTQGMTKSEINRINARLQTIKMVVTDFTESTQSYLNKRAYELSRLKDKPFPVDAITSDMKDIMTFAESMQLKKLAPSIVLEKIANIAQLFSEEYDMHMKRSASIEQLAEDKVAAHKAMVDILHDLNVDKNEVAQLAQSLGQTMVGKTIVKLNERMRMLQNDIKEMEKRVATLRDRSDKYAEQQRTLLATLDQQYKELADVEREFKKAVARAFDNSRGQRVNIQGLDRFIFDPEVAGSINKYLKPQSFGILDEVFNAITAINNFSRSMLATGDASFFGVTGLLASYSFPSAVETAFKTALADIGNEAKYLEYVRKYDARAKADNMPTMAEWQKYGLHLSGIVSPGGEDYRVTRVGESRVQKFAERMQDLPIVKQSDIMYSISSNIVRLEIAQNLYLAHYDPFMTNAQKVQLMRNIAEATNKMTGFTERAFGDIGAGTGSIAPLIFFASRWTSSQFAVLHDAATKTDLRGAKAREALLRMIGIGGLFTVLINEILGNDTEFNPLDPNFMKIRVGDFDISLFGPWDSLVRGIIVSAQGLPGVPGSGSPDYFFRSKLSPLAGVAVDVATGSTAVGTPVDGWYALSRVMPFSISGIIRDIKENADRNQSIDQLAVNSVIAILTGVFGIKSSALTDREYMEKEMRKDGVDINDPLAVKQWKLEHPDKVPVSKMPEVVAYHKARDEYQQELATLERRFKNNEITMAEWLDAKNDALNRFLGKTQGLLDDGGGRKVTDDVKDKRNWIAAYFSIYDVAKDENGRVDQIKFDEELSKFVAKYGEEALNYVYEYIDIGRDEISNMRANAVRKLTRVEIDGKVVNYFNMPKLDHNVLVGKNSWGINNGPYMTEKEYEEFLQNIVDYVENRRSIGQVEIERVRKGEARLSDVQDRVLVHQEESFVDSLKKLMPEIAKENIGGITSSYVTSAVYNNKVFQDVITSRKESAQNPLIKEIRQMYPCETRIFDKDVKKRDIEAACGKK
jgi:hypothetical protein